MKISLEEAIEIHARALVRRHRDEAPANARDYASQRKRHGDSEGYDIWLGVAATAQRLLKEKSSAGSNDDWRDDM